MSCDPNHRKPFFRFVKSILRIFIRKPRVVCEGGCEPEAGALYISNHVGAFGPLVYELYFPHRFRFWGTYEMTGTLAVRFRYLYRVYFHQKKKIPLPLSFLIALLAVPILRGFYRGMNLIPTYPDVRFVTTVRKSVRELSEGGSLIIFPENSSDGYHDVLTEYFAGFLYLARVYCKRTGIDLPIYNMYYHKRAKTLLIGRRTTYLSLVADGASLAEIANRMKDEANALRARFDGKRLSPSASPEEKQPE